MAVMNDLRWEKLGFEGVRTLVDWAAGEGWNPGLQDAEKFWATDPEGFYGFYKGDEMIAGGSLVSYAGHFGFMGLFIVKPEYRASGTGSALWYRRRDLLLERLHPGAAIGMDGVVAMQDFYRKGGFADAFRDERHERNGAVFDPDPRISRITDDDLPGVLDFDRRCFGFDRPAFIIPWLRQVHAAALKFEENGQLKGFAVLRKVRKGYKTGPLFAENPEVAEALYRCCLSNAHGEPVFLDIPSANPAAVALVKRYQTVCRFECARMYYGPPPALPLEHIYGITTLELG